MFAQDIVGNFGVDGLAVVGDNPSRLESRVGTLAYRPRRLPLNKTKLMTVTALPVSADGIAGIKGKWAVARVWGQHEAALVEWLDHMGLGWFLPFETLKRRDNEGKPRYTRRLLFPNYVPFACQFDVDGWAVRSVRCVCEVLDPPLQDRFVREISDLHTVIESGFKIDPAPDVVVGRRCRVHTGPLRGIEGKLVHRDDKNDIVVLQTQVLGSSGVKVPLEVVEVID